jgi:hypothetical protein
MTKAWMDLKYLYAIVSRGVVPIWPQNFGWLLNWSLFGRSKLAKHNMCNLGKKTIFNPKSWHISHKWKSKQNPLNI